MSRELGAAQLELLDDVADLLEAVNVAVRFALAVGYDQKRGPLKQQHLVGLDNLGKVEQIPLQHVHVGDQLVDDAGPRLVQRLIPDARLEARAIERPAESLQVVFPVFVHLQTNRKSENMSAEQRGNNNWMIPRYQSLID